jgi:acyl phosphate:glycerol-3-phosphate acyltransferase
MFPAEPVTVAVIGYLLGSIPFGLILTRLFGAGDLRQIGSGNIGATNVLRTGRKGLAAATLLLDAGKGAMAVLIGAAIAPGLGTIGGAAAIVGHCYPVWLRFKGGKGVATAFGIVLAVKAFVVALVCAGVWAAVLALARISSLASLAAVVAAPVVALILGERAVFPLLCAIAVLIVWKHRANIARLVAGTEPRVGQKT